VKDAKSVRVMRNKEKRKEEEQENKLSIIADPIARQVRDLDKSRYQLGRIK
jgi:hypothetical protein